MAGASAVGSSTCVSGWNVQAGASIDSTLSLAAVCTASGCAASGCEASGCVASRGTGCCCVAGADGCCALPFSPAHASSERAAAAVGAAVSVDSGDAGAAGLLAALGAPAVIDDDAGSDVVPDAAAPAASAPLLGAPGDGIADAASPAAASAAAMAGWLSCLATAIFASALPAGLFPPWPSGSGPVCASAGGLLREARLPFAARFGSGLLSLLGGVADVGA